MGKNCLTPCSITRGIHWVKSHSLTARPPVGLYYWHLENEPLYVFSWKTETPEKTIFQKDWLYEFYVFFELNIDLIHFVDSLNKFINLQGLCDWLKYSMFSTDICWCVCCFFGFSSEHCLWETMHILALADALFSIFFFLHFKKSLLHVFLYSWSWWIFMFLELFHHVNASQTFNAVKACWKLISPMSLKGWEL